LLQVELIFVQESLATKIRTILYEMKKANQSEGKIKSKKHEKEPDNFAYICATDVKNTFS
jgi:hypothetical protein